MSNRSLLKLKIKFKMFISQKKPAKGTHLKPKQYEADRWDHSGFDQLQQELNQNFYREERNNGFNKQRKFNNDSTMVADAVEVQRSDKKNSNINNRWTHVISLSHDS